MSSPEEGNYRWLSPAFLNSFKNRKVPFGFNGLGEIVYRRTYSRIKEDEDSEVWWESIARVVTGTFDLMFERLGELTDGFTSEEIKKLEQTAQTMYSKMFHMKFLPPGRGLWAMGSPATDKKRLFDACNNCGFVSTEIMFEKGEASTPFVFLMDMCMLGVGIGFDTKGAGLWYPGPNISGSFFHEIEDSREGWVESVRILLDSYFYGKPLVGFGYSLIRPQGQPLKTFGGVASGPQPLIELHDFIRQIFQDNKSDHIVTITLITDLMNVIGRTVIAGNIRRTAEIAIGPSNSEEFNSLKDYGKRPEREMWGCYSNNTISAELGQDYHNIAEHIRKNGEPGVLWLENMKKYSRMNGVKDRKDLKATGGNPCLEQTLESFELCCLVEVFLNNATSEEDFLSTLRCAFLYAKIVTLGDVQWLKTQEIIKRNRRIGTSLTGVAQFVSEHDLHTLKKWCHAGYKLLKEEDSLISKALEIPKSIKRTCIKPSGTVSLLAGATPGMHWPIANFYIRRIRVAKQFTEPLIQAGYNVHKAGIHEPNTWIVEIPVCNRLNQKTPIRTLNEVSMWEQISMAAFLQKHWADNQVSCTVTFSKAEGKDIENALQYMQYHLKGISFLPAVDHQYPDAPYEEISEQTYLERRSFIKDIDWSSVKKERADRRDEFCSDEKCVEI
jgi:hypothetical protein